MVHKNFLKILAFFMCMSFFYLGSGTALAANSWYVVSGDTGNQIKYYKDGNATTYSNNWSSANSSTTSADNLNTFLNGNDANSPANGDTVYIKAGTYKLSAEINLNKLLHLYGGFDGTETTSSDRNFETGTILDADANSDNPRRVLIIGTASTIDGFTIKGGYVDNDGDGGGGIYINGSPTITNCIITGNTIYNNGGGGINIKSGNPTITNCIITGNTTQHGDERGGGINISGGNPIITNCTVTGNTVLQGKGGGIHISGGNPTIINCTIAGNNATGTAGSSSNGRGGGFYITNNSSNPTITNCTIVNNQAGNQGHEIFADSNSGTITLRNTLVWNANTNAINDENTRIIYNNSAYPSATGTVNIALTAWNSPVSSDEKVKGVTHKVYKIFENYSALQGIIGKGSHDIAPSFDQIGNAFANPPSIGAAEYVPPVLSLDITGTETINTNYGTAKTETFTPVVSLDNVALTSTDYTVSWDVEVSSDVSGISINSGDLTVGDTTPAGSYTVTVKAQATYTAITTPVIKSSVAEKTVTITVESGDITLTLTSKDLPSGKVGTAYTEAEYFTATVDPSSADIAWSVEGLPAGLSFDKGKISGTPTASGDFSVKVTVTATLANYNTVSKDITASITIAAADEQSGGGSESSDITLTLTSQTLPNGKVGTAYTKAQYFTATATPSSADIAWEVEGLPAGLSFNKGTISGTPTASGDFSVKVTVTATLTNYTTTSKDITASITIAAADEQSGSEGSGGSGGSESGSGGSESGSGGSTDDGKTITVPSSGISGLTDTQKRTVETLILNSVNDLSQITATDFPNLTSVKISSDVEVGSGGALDLSSLPASIKNFSISGNTSIKSLNLKASKVANVDASGCSELKSVDVSGNTSIITLDVRSTDIKLLDASNCSNLTSVDCSYCLLSELNVVACNALKSINCSHNSLLILDIPSGLTNLTSINCEGQVLYNWSPSLILNFDEFVQSYDKSASASSVVRVSATKLTNVKNLKAYDNNNEEIAIITSDDNGNITFASAPDTMKYDYEIGDINNTLMDVTVYSDGSSSKTNTLGSSGGGCNMGVGALMLIALAMFSPHKRQKI